MLGTFPHCFLAIVVHHQQIRNFNFLKNNLARYFCEALLCVLTVLLYNSKWLPYGLILNKLCGHNEQEFHLLQKQHRILFCDHSNDAIMFTVNGNHIDRFLIKCNFNPQCQQIQLSQKQLWILFRDASFYSSTGTVTFTLVIKNYSIWADDILVILHLPNVKYFIKRPNNHKASFKSSLLFYHNCTNIKSYTLQHVILLINQWKGNVTEKTSYFSFAQMCIQS